MKTAFVLSLLFAAVSVPASAEVTVETATGDWSKLPQLSQRGYDHLSETMQAKLYEIAASKQCPSFLLKTDRLDFRTSFAVQYASDGSLSRIVFPKLDCPAAESVVGGTLLEMVQGGDYAPGGKSAAGWYQGGLGFSFTGKDADNPSIVKPNTTQVAETVKDPNEIVCQRVPVIGSRLESKRICMSRAKWLEQQRSDREEVDLAQKRRALEAH